MLFALTLPAGRVLPQQEDARQQQRASRDRAQEKDTERDKAEQQRRDAADAALMHKLLPAFDEILCKVQWIVLDYRL